LRPQIGDFGLMHLAAGLAVQRHRKNRIMERLRVSISISDSISRPETGQRNRSALTLRVPDGIACSRTIVLHADQMPARKTDRHSRPGGRITEGRLSNKRVKHRPSQTNQPHRRNPADQILGNKSGPLTYRAKLCESARLRDGAQLNRTPAHLVDHNLPTFSALTAGQAQGADARPPA